MLLLQEEIGSESILETGKFEKSLSIKKRSSWHSSRTRTSKMKKNHWNDSKNTFSITPFFCKQSIFDPSPENCLSFSEKSPQKIV